MELPKTYPALMDMYLLRPIHDQNDAETAAEMIDLLAGFDLNDEQSDYLDLLSDLYEKWEITQFPVNHARGAELLRLTLEARNEKGVELAKLLKIDASLAYRLLRGERQLTASQIRTLSEHYGLNAAALLN